MAIEVETKDTTGLSDTEIAEMADVTAESPSGFDVGFLSKQRDEWVLVTRVRDGEKLTGFAFSTLERIGGTPSMLIGVAAIKRTARRDTVLRALLGDLFRKALLAFPDEDVLLGTRVVEPGAYVVTKGLEDVVPRPGHRPSGEERAWGRRLAKRFGAEGRLDDRSFVIAPGGEGVSGYLDHSTAKLEWVPEGVDELFAGVAGSAGGSLVLFGWAMAEDLASGKLARS
jgi:hypothetical protein